MVRISPEGEGNFMAKCGGGDDGAKGVEGRMT